MTNKQETRNPGSYGCNERPRDEAFGERSNRKEKRRMQGNQKIREAFYSCSSCNAEKNAVFVVNIEPVKEALAKRLKEHVRSVDWGRVVGFIDISRHANSSAGILVCETKAYFFGFPKKAVKVWYDEIDRIVARKSNEEFVGIELKFRNGSSFTWDSNALDCGSLVAMFNTLRRVRIEACDAYTNANLRSHEQISALDEAGGFAVGNKGTANKIFDEERFHSRQGHGFAAERANNLEDRLHGKKARIVGDNNIKNGPDRAIVNPDGSTTWIQSKYCMTGKASVNACFEGNGSGAFRYLDASGKPMLIEVALDNYDEAVAAMAKKIQNNQVPGITDPGEAKNIIRQGSFTYDQAKNIAKAGNVDSVIYDVKSGAVISLSAFGISAAITLAVCLWNGDEPKLALKNAAFSGIKVGGTALVASVISSQIAKSSINAMLNPGFQALAKAMGPKAYAVIANAFRSGSGVSGAAAINSAAKLLKGNAISAVVTTAVLTLFDVSDIVRGRISGKQMATNLAKTSSTVLGGTAGWVGGSAIGSLIMPGVGTVVGGFIGSVVAGGGAGILVDKVTGRFVDSDAEKMMELIQRAFLDTCEEYLLNQDEAEKVSDELGEKLNDKSLKRMHASKDRYAFAKNMIKPLAREQAKNRARIGIPSEQLMEEGIDSALMDIAERMNDDIE